MIRDHLHRCAECRVPLLFKDHERWTAAVIDEETGEELEEAAAVLDEVPAGLSHEEAVLLCDPCSTVAKAVTKAKRKSDEAREPRQRTIKPEVTTRTEQQARKILARMRESKKCQRRVKVRKRGRGAASLVRCNRLESEHPKRNCAGFLSISPREERARLKLERAAERQRAKEEKETQRIIVEHRKRVAESLARAAARKEEDKLALARGWQAAGMHAIATRRVKVGESKSGRLLYKTKGKPLCGFRLRKDAVLVRGTQPHCKACLRIVEHLNERAEARKEAAVAKKSKSSKKVAKKAPAKKGAKGKKAKRAGAGRSGAKDWFRSYMKGKASVKRADVVKTAEKKFGEAGANSVRCWISGAKKSNVILGYKLKENDDKVLTRAGKK